MPANRRSWRVMQRVGMQRDPADDSAGDLREIERAVSAVTVQGARYPEHLQKLVGR